MAVPILKGVLLGLCALVLAQTISRRWRRVVLLAILSGAFLWPRFDFFELALKPGRTITECERAAASLSKRVELGDVYGFGTGPSAHLSPLYPIILSGLYHIWGDYTTETGRAAQSIFSLVATLAGLALLPVIARRGGLPEPAGWLGAFAAAGFPLHRWTESVGQHEQPLAALALLSTLLVAIRLMRERCARTWTLLAAGVLLGLTALLCPSLLLAAVLMLSLAVWHCRQWPRRVFQAGLLMISVCGLCLLPWIVRNQCVLGAPVALRSNFGLELAIGNAPDGTGYTYSLAFKRLHPIASTEMLARLIADGEISFMEARKQEAIDWIRENPGRFLQHTLNRAYWFWLAPGDAGGEPSLLSREVLPTLLLALAGVIELLRQLLTRTGFPGLFSAALLGASLPYLVTHVEPRYPMPVTGLLFLLAASLSVALCSACIPGHPFASNHSNQHHADV